MLRTEQPHASQVVGELVASAKVGQTVRAKWNGLAGVAIRLGTYGRRNTGSLVFHLRASPDADTDLVVVRVDSTILQDNEFQLFKFRPIIHSADRTFYFYLEAPQAKSGNAITIWGSSEDRYSEGEAVMEGLPNPGGTRSCFLFNLRASSDLTMVDLYRSSVGIQTTFLWK